MNRFDLAPEPEASVLRREKAMLMSGIPVGGTLTLAHGKLMWKRGRWSSFGAIFDRGPSWLEVDVDKCTVAAGGRRVPWTEVILSLIGIGPIIALITLRLSLLLGWLNLIVLLLAGAFRRTIEVRTSTGVYHFAVRDTQPWLQAIGGVRLPGPARVRQGLRIGVLWPLLILLALLATPRVGFLALLTTDGGTADTATPTPSASPTPSLETPAPTATPPPFLHPNLQSLEQATVVEVIDGDTIDVLIDGKRQPVRYYGIDAPEMNEKCYQEATERNRELVGTTVRLETDARNEDEHGRLLRYVFTSEGVSVDAALVSEGLAKAWTEDGRYVRRLTILETHAREQGIGCLWR